ncbi:uncharacterized protein LOC141641348 [Silene latifolia]|uniref:uncharacterized protein LOC141641348 n=1 Tax=Silene latifolia TaxID=37657 RepID=UPI003D773F76
MADRSLKKPMGVLEDVLVRVGKYFIPSDFIVMDMAEDSQVHIILGRPFLHTAGALIDVRHGSLTLRVGDDTIRFVLYNISKHPPDSKASCHMINVFDPTSDCLALCSHRNPPDAPAIASYPWSMEGDDIEKLICGDDPPPEME